MVCSPIDTGTERWPPGTDRTAIDGTLGACAQSADGSTLGWSSVIALPQHSTSPPPALMHSTSVPQVSQWNRLPNWFGMAVSPSAAVRPTLLLLHLLAAAL